MAARLRNKVGAVAVNVPETVVSVVNTCRVGFRYDGSITISGNANVIERTMVYSLVMTAWCFERSIIEEALILRLTDPIVEGELRVSPLFQHAPHLPIEVGRLGLSKKQGPKM